MNQAAPPEQPALVPEQAQAPEQALVPERELVPERRQVQAPVPVQELPVPERVPGLAQRA